MKTVLVLLFSISTFAAHAQNVEQIAVEQIRAGQIEKNLRDGLRAVASFASSIGKKDQTSVTCGDNNLCEFDTDAQYHCHVQILSGDPEFGLPDGALAIRLNCAQKNTRTGYVCERNVRGQINSSADGCQPATI